MWTLFEGIAKMPDNFLVKFGEQFDLHRKHDWEMQNETIIQCKTCNTHNTNSHCLGPDYFPFIVDLEKHYFKKSPQSSPLRNTPKMIHQNENSSLEEYKQETSESEEEQLPLEMAMIKKRVQKEELERKKKKEKRSISQTQNFQDMTQLMAIILRSCFELMLRRQNKLKFRCEPHNWVLNVWGVKCCRISMIEQDRAKTGDILFCSGEKSPIENKTSKQDESEDRKLYLQRIALLILMAFCKNQSI